MGFRRMCNDDGRPPAQKELVTPEELLEMVSPFFFGLCDVRDRAMLLLGYAAGLNTENHMIVQWMAKRSRT